MQVSRLAGLILLVFSLGFALGLPGCGSGNPNEREFLATAPPGKPSDDPEDSKVSHRRERTRNVAPQVAKIEARNQGATAKKTKAP